MKLSKFISLFDALLFSLLTLVFGHVQEILGTVSIVLSISFTIWKWRKEVKGKNDSDKGSFLPVLLFIACLGSCCPTAEVIKETQFVYLKDTSSSKIDTTRKPISIPGDSLALYGIQLEAYKDSLDSCRVRPINGMGSSAKTKIKYVVKDSKLNIDVVVKPYLDTIDVLNTTITHDRTMYESYYKNSETTVGPRKCSVWRHWPFYAALAGNLVLIAWIFRRPILKLFKAGL